MEAKELRNILTKHRLWLSGKPDGKRADLHSAYLRDAGLQGANLQGAYLRDANLQGADLRDADLRDADLRDADLRDAKLQFADLHGAYLRDADLQGANLLDADLLCANLQGAGLQGACLQGADLQGAYLRDADLQGANLLDAKNVPYLPQTIIHPIEGAFIGWKKVDKRYLIKLRICEDAKRSCATGRKCRCSAAEVLGITRIDTGERVTSVLNEAYSSPTLYEVGKIVTPDSFDDNRWNECSHGIHFFMTEQEARDY